MFYYSLLLFDLIKFFLQKIKIEQLSKYKTKTHKKKKPININHFICGNKSLNYLNLSSFF
jgi:hypothetical protein